MLESLPRCIYKCIIRYNLPRPPMWLNQHQRPSVGDDTLDVSPLRQHNLSLPFLVAAGVLRLVTKSVTPDVSGITASFHPLPDCPLMLHEISSWVSTKATSAGQSTTSWLRRELIDINACPWSKCFRSGSQHQKCHYVAKVQRTVINYISLRKGGCDNNADLGTDASKTRLDWAKRTTVA